MLNVRMEPIHKPVFYKMLYIYKFKLSDDSWIVPMRLLPAKHLAHDTEL